MQIYPYYSPHCFILLSTFLLAAGVSKSADYVGAQACADCHQQQYQDWQRSHHYRAMQPATAENVLGDFSDVTATFHGIENRMFTKGERFFIETIGPDGKVATFPILYTFGFEPLQQYLVEIDGGRLQALNVAWDNRPKTGGGQRWYHLQPQENITAEHPFFWAGHFQNWNSRCAECHVTDYQKGFDLESFTYQSRWSEMNVACEACHGPAAEHLELAKAGKLSTANSGFSRVGPTPLTWQYPAGETIARPTGDPSSDHIDMCGRCHARRMPLAEQLPNADFHNVYQLQLLEEGAYFADGQILDEVFVLGSFLQSKMHAQGVTCHDCHNPHTGKVKVEGNGLCAQCHLPTEYDNPTHHHHVQGSAAAQCVNCHMPARTYMGVDDRRDHSFTIPRPDISQQASVPNACQSCHVDKDSAWLSAALNTWGVEFEQQHWALTHQKIRNFDPAAVAPINAWLAQDQAETVKENEETSAHARSEQHSLPPIVHATLLAQLAQLAHLALVPSQQSLQIAQGQLQHADPMIRRAAVVAISAGPPQLRWQLLEPYLDDPSRQVRFAVASALAELTPQLPASAQTAMNRLIEEYRQMLEHTIDSPATQLTLAGLENALGNDSQALIAYQRALKISPAYVPALVNLSEYYRHRDDHAEAEALLKRALQAAPESAVIQHAFGLHLVRIKNYPRALEYLQRAITAEGAQPRHAYVYAIAQDSIGDTKGAIRTLIQANTRWPNQYDILWNLVVLLDKSGQTMSIRRYLAALSAIAPRSPQLLQLQRKYRQ